MASALTTAAREKWVRAFAESVAAEKQHLTALDSAIGDADHGANLDRGLSAVVAALDATPPTTIGGLFKMVGMTLVSKVGGASGPLYGTFFLRLGQSAGEVAEIDPATFAAGLRAGLDGVVARGKAEAGDKTMYDALAPALDALDAALADGKDVTEALAAASAAADVGRDATTPLQARKGRASYLGERSIGHQDPGATSSALLLAAAARALG
jgi:dihydroxyacetone kinase-like protein